MALLSEEVKSIPIVDTLRSLALVLESVYE